MNEFLQSINYMSWVLPALLAIPLIGAVLVWLTPTPRRRGLEIGADEVVAGIANGPRWIAFLVLVVEFVVSLGLWWAFDPAVGNWQAYFDVPWIPSWGVRFTLGIDGIALMMILLTTATTR
jgi:NADH-quinone oxidoreductase subunit M